MKQRTADMMKVSKVIKSCKTREQLDTAAQMAKAWKKTYSLPGGDVPDFEPHFIYIELLQEINQQAKIIG